MTPATPPHLRRAPASVLAKPPAPRRSNALVLIGLCVLFLPLALLLAALTTRSREND